MDWGHLCRELSCLAAPLKSHYNAAMEQFLAAVLPARPQVGQLGGTTTLPELDVTFDPFNS